MPDRPKQNLLSVYGVFPAVAAIIPAVACASLSIYFASYQQYDFHESIVEVYPVLRGCKIGTLSVISSILYVYRYLSMVMIAAALSSIIISAIYRSSFFGFIAITSSIFCAPLIALQIPWLIILSRDSMVEICAYRNLPIDAIMHLFFICIASYIIWGNFVISLRHLINGAAQ